MTLEEIRERIVELQESMQAIIANAEELNRELSDDEAEEVDDLLASINDDLRVREARMEKVEAEKHRIALAQKPVIDVQNTTSILAVPKSHQNLRAFTGENGERDAYRAGLWFKAAFLNDNEASRLCNDYGIFNTATEGTNSAGGYLVPDELSSAIIAVRNRAGVSRRLCKVVGMASDVMNIPKITAGLTVEYPAEAAEITASDQTWGQVALAVAKRAVIAKCSNELLADAVIGVIDDLAVGIGNSLAVQEDNELINGDGTSTFGGETGLTVAIAAGGTTQLASSNTSFADIALADLNTLVGTMPDKYYGSATPSWLIGRQTWSSYIQALVYAAGGNTISDLASGAAPQLFGFPVEISDQMPADGAQTFACFFGNFQDAVLIGERELMEISVSEEAYWSSDITAVKGTTRYDINVHDVGDASDAGAVVGLKTAAS